LAQEFTHPANYPFLKLGGGFVSECERDDVSRRQARTVSPKQVHYTPCHHLRLS
jgi:hypothetical protein